MDKKPHVLLVDDNVDLLFMMRSMLGMSGFEVSTRDNGHDLENVIQQLAPDLLIMDMLLSGADGRDVCRQLRANETLGQIPIMMISAHPNAKEQCLAAGADHFIGKPFDMKEFIGKVREAVAR